MGKELIVRVLNATGVLLPLAPPSCYVVVKYDGKLKRTKTLESHNPHWDQTLVFELTEISQPIAFRFMESTSELCAFKLEFNPEHLREETAFKCKVAESSEIFVNLKIVDSNMEEGSHIDEEDIVDATEIVEWSPDLTALRNATEVNPKKQEEPQNDSLRIPSVFGNIDITKMRLKIKIIGITGSLDPSLRRCFIMVKYGQRRKRTAISSGASEAPTWNKELTFNFFQGFKQIEVRFYNYKGKADLVSAVKQEFELTLEPKEYEVKLWDYTPQAFVKLTVHLFDPDHLEASRGDSCESNEEFVVQSQTKTVTQTSTTTTVKSHTTSSPHNEFYKPHSSEKCKYCVCKCSKEHSCRNCAYCFGCKDCGCACACRCTDSISDGCSDCGDCDDCGNCGNCKGCQCSCKCSAPKCSGGGGCGCGGCGSCDSDDDCCVIV